MNLLSFLHRKHCLSHTLTGNSQQETEVETRQSPTQNFRGIELRNVDSFKLILKMNPSELNALNIHDTAEYLQLN